MEATPNPETPTMCHRPLIASLLFALFAGSALAQDVKVYRAGELVDPHDVAAILDGAKAPKMRSIRLLDDAPAQQVASAEPAPTAEARADKPSSLALPVQFSFDSADILPAAKSQLDALAEGIRLLPADKAVLIEGHTDAAGSADYNEKLSQRRAQAVKRYLVAQHGLDPARLRALGMGEYRTLDGRDPYAPENRRVQFRGE
jgi:outer membrane protein OmpA-like peptidoglycan-associated protein